MILVSVYSAFMLAAALDCPGPEWTTAANTSHFEKCYKLTAKKYSQAECAEQCGDGASLVSIESAVENEFIFRHVAKLEFESFAWIGLFQAEDTESSAKGWYGWASTPLNNSGFANWRPGFPVDYNVSGHSHTYTDSLHNFIVLEI